MNMKKMTACIVLLAMALMMTACGGDKPAQQTAKEVNLTEVMGKFAFDGDMLELDASYLLDAYGIAAEDMKQFAARVNSTGIDCDEVVLVEAVSAEAAARVKTALDNRYQAKLIETENYLPEEYAIIKTCSVTVNGNHVAMIVANNAEDMVRIYNESFK